jgi:hypothetical protein
MDVLDSAGSGAAESQTMSSMAERYIARIRGNLESWRAGEIDFVTFNEWQRLIWAAICAAGKDIEASVLSGLTGSPLQPAVCIPGRDDTQTVQLRLTPAATPRLGPGRYRGELRRTDAGYPMLRVSTAEPGCHPDEHRLVAALVYDLAADMERRSQHLEAHWTIAPDADSGHVVVELAGEYEAMLADEFITNIMFHHRLI